MCEERGVRGIGRDRYGMQGVSIRMCVCVREVYMLMGIHV